MMKKKKALEAAKALKVAPVQAQQVRKVVSTQVSTTAPKCNCPKKHPQVVNNLKTTTNDFTYQPPKIQLNQPLIARPQVQQVPQVVEMNNNYPRFEEVEVKSPYPKFDTPIMKNEAPQVMVPRKACTCQKNNCNSNVNVYDINKY